MLQAWQSWQGRPHRSGGGGGVGGFGRPRGVLGGDRDLDRSRLGGGCPMALLARCDVCGLDWEAGLLLESV